MIVCRHRTCQHYKKDDLPLIYRQRHIIRALADGKSQKEIAADLHLSDKSIEKSLAAARQQMGCANDQHLVVICAQYGIVPCPPFNPMRYDSGPDTPSQSKPLPSI